MRMFSRPRGSFDIPLPSVGTAVVAAVVPSVAAALFAWHGTRLAAILPLAAIVLCSTVFVLVRRSLRRASTLIDTILREELGHEEPVAGTPVTGDREQLGGKR